MSLARCLSAGSRCVRDVPLPDSVEPNDNLQFPISILRSVGLGQANDPDEVRTIQQALNRFGPGLGGPDPKLVPDGKVGPKTNAAIVKFQTRQLGFADGRVDPNQKTISRINQLVATVFVTVDPKIIKKIYENLLPEIRGAVLDADAALLAARNAILFGPGPINPGAASVALVNKHFSLDRNPNAARDFELIRGLFRNMLALVHRNLGNFELTFIASPGRFDAARVLASGVFAITFPNGVNLRGSVLKAKAQDGSDIVIPQDKILITAKFRFITRDLQISTLIHEMAHYLGEADGNPDTIDDPPGGNSAPDQIKKLAPKQKPRIAQCYADFAFEAHFKRDPLVLIL
jgi:hypothetical protein